MSTWVCTVDTTSSYFSKGNSVSFPEKCSAREGLGFAVLCVRSAGVKGICANGLLCTVRADSPSCQSLGFLVEARYSTETIVEKKEL